MRSNEVRRSVEAWMSRVSGDLRAAVFAAYEADMAWLSCNHSQQAAEKAIKAYLVWLGEVRIPRIHDLEKLAVLVLARGGRPLPDQPLNVLNRYIVVRYPEEGDPDTSEAKRALDLAQDIVSVVREAMIEGDEDAQNHLQP